MIEFFKTHSIFILFIFTIINLLISNFIYALIAKRQNLFLDSLQVYSNTIQKQIATSHNIYELVVRQSNEIRENLKKIEELLKTKNSADVVLPQNIIDEWRIFKDSVMNKESLLVRPGHYDPNIPAFKANSPDWRNLFDENEPLPPASTILKDSE